MTLHRKGYTPLVIPNACEESPALFQHEILPPYGRQNDIPAISNVCEESFTNLFDGCGGDIPNNFLAYFPLAERCFVFQKDKSI